MLEATVVSRHRAVAIVQRQIGQNDSSARRRPHTAALRWPWDPQGNPIAR